MDLLCDNCNLPGSATNPIWTCARAHEWAATRVVGGRTYFAERGLRQVTWCKQCLDASGFGGVTSGDFGQWARCPVCGKHMRDGGE